MLAQQGTGNQLQLLIVILPEVSGSYGMHTLSGSCSPLQFVGNFVVYMTLFAGKVKRVCETDIGIESECCLPKHASRPNKQYLENVALNQCQGINICVLCVKFLLWIFLA